MLQHNPSIASAVEPDELDMLQGIFEEVCRNRGIIKGSDTATQLASDLIHLFQTGVRDPQKLQAMLT